jgi:hypothetical protein
LPLFFSRSLLTTRSTNSGETNAGTCRNSSISPRICSAAKVHERAEGYEEHTERPLGASWGIAQESNEARLAGMQDMMKSKSGGDSHQMMEGMQGMMSMMMT